MLPRSEKLKNFTFVQSHHLVPVDLRLIKQSDLRHELPWDAEKPIVLMSEEKSGLETSKAKKRIELQSDPMFNFGLAMRIQVGCPELPKTD